MSEQMKLDPQRPLLVLIIAGDISDRSLLTALLMDAGYRVSEATTGCRGLEEFTVQKPDAVVLDLRLPDVPGSEIVRQLRERSSVPILALSAETSAYEDEAARTNGADDVIAKPFDLVAFSSRLTHLLREAALRYTPIRGRFTVGDLSIDLDQQQVSVRGRAVVLSDTEFSLLATLVYHAGRAVTYRVLTNQLWNSNAVLKIAFLKLVVSSLRHKLESDPVHPRYVLTERGTGYRLAIE